jgi:hypothetical protein
MALGTVVLGSGAELHAATATLSVGVYTAGTYSPISDMNRMDYTRNRPTTNIAVFMRSAQYSIPGIPEQTIAVSGFFSEADTGQEIVRTAESADDVFAFKFLRDGTNGWEVFGRCGSIREAAAPEGLQEWSFDFLAVVDRTAIP